MDTLAKRLGDGLEELRRLENLDADGIAFCPEFDTDAWNHFDKFLTRPSNCPDRHGVIYFIIPWR